MDKVPGFIKITFEHFNSTGTSMHMGPCNSHCAKYCGGMGRTLKTVLILKQFMI